MLSWWVSGGLSRMLGSSGVSVLPCFANCLGEGVNARLFGAAFGAPWGPTGIAGICELAVSTSSSAV